MPYLPVDLDAKRKAEGIEKALALPRFAVLGGLIELWEGVWRDKSDVVDELALGAAFGPDERVRSALVAREFLEPADGGRFRVRGAAKWLFGMEGRKRGGQAAKANLIPGARHKKPAEKSPEPGNGLIGSSREPAESQPMPPLGSLSALTPSTQHPAPKEKEDDDERPAAASNPVGAFGAVAAPLALLQGAQPGRRAEDHPPTAGYRPPPGADIEFFGWAQQRRSDLRPGLIPENPLPTYPGWFKRAADHVGGDVDRLRSAWLWWLKDEWGSTRSPPYAMRCFQSDQVWIKHVPEVAAGPEPDTPKPSKLNRTVAVVLDAEELEQLRRDF